MNNELDKKMILYGWVRDTYGQKCKDYEKDCACCVAWELYMRLVQVKPLVESTLSTGNINSLNTPITMPKGETKSGKTRKDYAANYLADNTAGDTRKGSELTQTTGNLEGKEK